MKKSLFDDNYLNQIIFFTEYRALEKLFFQKKELFAH